MSFTSSHEQQESSSRPKVTIQSIQQKKGKQRITCLTAYDYPTARLVDEAGMHMILVVDSLSMVLLGQENTLAITDDEMLHHTRDVRRAVHSGLVIADMPYGSYQLGAEEALHNAERFIKEAGSGTARILEGEKRGGMDSGRGEVERSV